MFGNPHFDTTSVLNATILSNNMTVQSDTGNYGSTNFHYDWYSYAGQQSEDQSYCVYPVVGYEDLGGPGQVPACAIPDSESTSYVRQALADPVGAPTASDFLQTLVTVGNDDGNFIIESNNAYGSDSCSFDVTVPPITSVSNTTWTVGQVTPGYAEAQVVVPGHNQWGPDVVGYGPTAVRYYQLNRPKLGLSMPCGFSLHQNLEIQCVQDGTRMSYKANNPLTSTIDGTGVTNCRSGSCSRFTYP